MSTEKKPIPARKMALIAAVAFLLFFACGGTWAVKNAVTTFLVAVPIGLFFGLRYYARANEAALYAALFLAGGELIIWIFGGFDGLYRRVAMLGGQLQCTSLFALIAALLWVLNKRTHFVGKALADAGIDVEATKADIQAAAKETSAQVKAWLAKD